MGDRPVEDDGVMIPTLPAWVKKRDGRVVAFDPDVISQDLFSASETLGQADAFLARELTDGVLHFLGNDLAESVPTTAALAELVVKVVRELRHPRLAQAFAERPPRPDLSAPPPGMTPIDPSHAVRRSTLQSVFTRDLAAAHEQGLLQIMQLDGPLQVAAAVITPAGPSPYDRLEAVGRAREAVSSWLVLDGPEHDVWAENPSLIVQLLPPILDATGLTARLQLNCAEPPAWAQETARGPLFADSQPRAGLPGNSAEALLDVVLARGCKRMAIDWHLGPRDFDPERSSTLTKLAQAASGGSDVTFSVDRPRRAVQLGPGMDRMHPAVLMTVGLHLPRLLEHTAITDDVDLYLTKLASLARLAVSAGVQKRQYLREQTRAAGADTMLARGLLLERARVLVAPHGLDAVVRGLTGAGLCDSRGSLECGRRIVQQLQSAITAEGQARGIEFALDVQIIVDGNTVGQEFLSALPRLQLGAWGRMQAVTGTGTALVGLEQRTRAEEIVQLLQYAWQETDVSRLRFIRLDSTPKVMRAALLPEA